MAKKAADARRFLDQDKAANVAAGRAPSPRRAPIVKIKEVRPATPRAPREPSEMGRPRRSPLECVRCGVPMRTASQPRREGVKRHVGLGLCTTCYNKRHQ